MLTVENREGMVEQMYTRIWGVGSRPLGQNLKGSYTILRFIAFLLTSFSKICLEGAVSSPFPSPPPLCASMMIYLALCHFLRTLI